MAVLVPESRIKMLMDRNVAARKELARAATNVARGSGYYFRIVDRPRSEVRVEVSIYRGGEAGWLTDPLASAIINLIQHRSVLMELLMDLRCKAEDAPT